MILRGGALVLLLLLSCYYECGAWALTTTVPLERRVVGRRAMAVLLTPALVPSVARGESVRSLVNAGMQAFQGNNVDRSLALFDEAIRLSPSVKTRLWQRGLSLYYAGDYAAAAEQFESDVAENPNDTEESIWHFLSTAQLKGFDQATLLNVGVDPRPVMRTVYDLFQTGQRDKLETLATSSAASTAFYAALYLGLYAEAQGDQATSRRWLQAAVDNELYAQCGDYMYALAKVHLKRREGAPELRRS